MEHGRNAAIPPSAHFAVTEGGLACDGAPLSLIAEQHGTPTHVYSARAIERAFRSADASLRGRERPETLRSGTLRADTIRAAIEGAEQAGEPRHLICYAMKANGHPEIVRLLARLGAGVDVVSGGELACALRVGVAPDKIVFSGVGKSDAEIAAALDAGIRGIHVESASELDVIEKIAREHGVTARIGLRVNPDVDPATHPYIATGLSETKFGLDLETARRLVSRVVESADLELETIACHIGSQLSTARPLEDAIALVAAFAKECADAGAPIRAIDAGGGWPIAYGDEDVPHAPWTAFGEAIREGIKRGGADVLGLDVMAELGRALVGDAGALLTRVVHVKEHGGKRFVIVDAAMTELLRPSLYGAYHAIVPVIGREGEWSPADVVGPVCESGDFLAIDRPLPPVQRGDLLLVRGTGAYGAAMSSRYNLRPLAAEVLIDDQGPRVIRPRETIEQLLESMEKA